MILNDDPNGDENGNDDVNDPREVILPFPNSNECDLQSLPAVSIEHDGQFETHFIPLDSQYRTLMLGASHLVIQNRDTYQDHLTLLNFQIQLIALICPCNCESIYGAKIQDDKQN